MTANIWSLYPSHVAEVRARHDRALAEAGFDAVAIYGGELHIAFLDDMPYPFKVNPHFKAWAPVLTNPHCFIAYQPGAKPQMAYYQPVDYWHKPAGTPADPWTSEFEITMIAAPEDARKVMPRGRVAFVGEWSAAFESWGFAAVNPPGLLNRLHFARTVKTDYEIECVRIANRIGVRGHRAAEAAFRSGSAEYGIHLEYLRATGHVESELPYGNIVALNENASVLHYQFQEPVAPPAIRSFLIDAGAAFHGYACDITRTYSTETGRFSDLIDHVDRFQQDLCNEIRPGMDYREFHISAHRKVGQTLNALGIVSVDADAAVEKRITSAFFPHGIGHYLGLQVHDVAGFAADPDGSTIPKPEGHPYLRLTRIVEPRHVFTVEPGIYFIDSLLSELRKSDASGFVNWDAVDELRPFGGVRIEDDVVVTETGHENLTRSEFARSS